MLDEAPREIHLVMTTYERRELLERTLRSLAGSTDVLCRLWLMDDASQLPLPDPDVRQALAGGSVELGAIVRGGVRVGQAGQFNRGYALVEDWLRQMGWPYRAYLCKLEDDLEFTAGWLERLAAVWEHPSLAQHNVGLLGGAYGQEGPVIDIGGEPMKLTYHVGAWCMFAPMALWRQYLPLPNRGEMDAIGGEPPSASAADWHITRSGLLSVGAYGRQCGLLNSIVKHVGTKPGDSTWANC